MFCQTGQHSQTPTVFSLLPLPTETFSPMLRLMEQLNPSRIVLRATKSETALFRRPPTDPLVVNVSVDHLTISETPAQSTLPTEGDSVEEYMTPLPTSCYSFGPADPTHITPYEPNELVRITDQNLSTLSYQQFRLPPSIAPEGWYARRNRVPRSELPIWPLIPFQIDSLIWEEDRGRFPPYTTWTAVGVRCIPFHQQFLDGHHQYVGILLDPITRKTSQLRDNSVIYDPYGNGIGTVHVIGWFREFYKVRVDWELRRIRPDNEPLSREMYVHYSRMSSIGIEHIKPSTTHQIIQ